MRRIYIISLLLVSLSYISADAQSRAYVGIRGGLGGGSARFTPAEENKFMFGLPVFGASFKYFGKQKYVGAIQADLNYVKKGFEYLNRKDGDTVYQRTINAIEIPFSWQPHLPLFHGKGRMFINLGAYISATMSSDYKIYSKTKGDMESGKYELSSLRDNYFDYGLLGGFGFAAAIKRFEIQLEGRYVFGLSDVLKNGTKYPGNPRRSPVDQMNVTIGLYYRLWDKTE